MKKLDGEIYEKIVFWGILQLEWLRKCGWLLLLLFYCFVIGWVFFQLFVMIVVGIFLLGVLLFYFIIFVQIIVIIEKLNYVLFDLWYIFKLCLWYYGIIVGFIFMVECMLSKSIWQVQCLFKKFGVQDFFLCL